MNKLSLTKSKKFVTYVRKNVIIMMIKNIKKSEIIVITQENL